MANYNIDGMHRNELSAGIQSEQVARRVAQKTADRLGEPVYLYEVGSGDGESDGESEEILPTMPRDAVVVERMPEEHRASHRAAGNWGSYPSNGARRYVMSRDLAETMVADDEYDHIKGPADDDDLRNYGVVVS